MASLTNSLRLIFTDNNALPKILLLSLIPFYAYLFFSGKTSHKFSAEIYLIGLLLIIYLGFILQTLINSIQEKSYILAICNPFQLFATGIKSLPCGIFMVPIYFVFLKTSELFDYSYFGQYILAAIAYLITGSLFITSLILFGKKGNTFDGLNLIKIFKNFHEIIVYIVIYGIELAIFNAICALPIGAICYYIFGLTKMFYYIISILITVNMLLIAQSLSHVYFEQIKE